MSRFHLAVDEEAGVALRTCTQGGVEHPIGNSGDFLDQAEPQGCECLCESTELEIAVGVVLYPDSEDARWLYPSVAEKLLCGQAFGRAKLLLSLL